MTTFEWSKEIEFKRSEIRGQVPSISGVYKILQSEEYARYQRKTRVLKIGMSHTSLQQELINHFNNHTAANRLARIRKRLGITVTVQYSTVSSELAREVENELLQQFEDEHWELPFLNSTRGYKRNADKHLRTTTTEIRTTEEAEAN